MFVCTYAYTCGRIHHDLPLCGGTFSGIKCAPACRALTGARAFVCGFYAFASISKIADWRACARGFVGVRVHVG